MGPMYAPFAASRGHSLALAMVVLLLGCRAESKAPPEVHLSTASAGAELLTAALVTPQVKVHPRVLVRAVAVGGVARRYVLVVPGQVDATRRYPLVLYFHGDGGTGSSMQQNAPFEAASGDTALVAYPDGVGRTWDLETTHDNKDVAFVEALVTDVEHDFKIDRTQLFATGYSSGGFFANVLACQRASLLRAVASNAGGAPYHQPESWPNQFPKCPGEGPVAAIALHGEQDATVTLDSGRFTGEYWAYIDGCTLTEMETTAYPECRAYRGCKPGKDVVFCQVPGLNHWVWDKAARVTYEFFRREGMTP